MNGGAINRDVTEEREIQGTKGYAWTSYNYKYCTFTRVDVLHTVVHVGMILVWAWTSLGAHSLTAV